MRWIVGIDLDGRSAGTVHMAAWLRACHVGGTAPEFVGVHVVDERVRNSAKVMSEVIAAGERALASAAEQSGVASPFAQLRVVVAPSVEDGLAEAAAVANVDGVLIGRAAPSAGHRLVRLGSVARRLLRRLPAPVLVVPPDLTTDRIGEGAVLFATDLGPSSVAAGQFAGRIAAQTGRGLVAAHVDPDVGTARDWLGTETILAAWEPRRDIDDVERWLAEHEIPVARAEISREPVVEGVLALARSEDAPIVVCGSRRLDTADRVFTSSMASDLARFADRAVLVVPG
jgi:nucleotide-binding universal stress UspA family protein